MGKKQSSCAHLSTNNVRFFSFLLVLCFYGQTVQAQTIKGKVLDIESGLPLAGAVVRASGNPEISNTYQLTNQQGLFKLTISRICDSLQVSFLGYQTVMLQRPFADSLIIKLRKTRESLNAAIVVATKVTVAGDTIRYNVNALKRKEDVVLSDMLSRIPGVEVDKQGFVKYNGVRINRFYVEGKDVLENNYNLATRNLSIEAIKEVEVLENHQPVKLLQGVTTSERAALNIVLNEKARTKVNWGVSGGLGAATEKPNVTASARLSAFYVGKKFSTMNVGGYDDQGFALREQDFAPEAGQPYGHHDMARFLADGVSQAPLSDRRSLFNRSREVSTVNQVPFSETATLGVTLKYGADNKASESSQTAVYKSPDAEDRTLDRVVNKSDGMRTASALLSFRNNGKKVYLSNQLYADWTFSGGETLVSGGMNRLQNTEGRLWNVDNNASASFKVGDRLYSVESFTQLAGMRESLSLDADALHQDVSVSFFCQNLSVSGISRRSGNWRFTMRPGMDFLLYNRTSSLEGLPIRIPDATEGTSRVNLLKIGLKGEATYRKTPVEVVLSADVKGGRCRLGNETSGFPLGGIYARFKYLTGRWDLSARASAGFQDTDCQELGGPAILTGYYTLWKARKRVAVTPFGLVSLEGRFREPVSGWNSRVSSALNWSRSFLSARDLYNDFVLGYLTDVTVPQFSVTSRLELTKGLFSINGNISFSLVHAFVSSSLIQNGIGADYRSHLLNPEIKANISLNRWWGISSEARLNAYKYTASGVASSWNVDAAFRLNQSFYLSSSLFAGAAVDLYYHAAVGRPYVFPSLSLTWKGPKALRVKLEADNLADVRTYSWRSESPLLTQNYQVKIRPLTVLAGLEWRF